MANIKKTMMFIIQLIFSLLHIIDVNLDILYLKETPMENDDYYILLIIFLILPIICVVVIAILTTKRYKKGFSGFLLFTFGGLTNTTKIIMSEYYKIEE